MDNSTQSDARKDAIKRSIDRMVAEVVLKASNSTPEQKKAARQTLKRVKTVCDTSKAWERTENPKERKYGATLGPVGNPGIDV